MSDAELTPADEPMTITPIDTLSACPTLRYRRDDIAAILAITDDDIAEIYRSASRAFAR